MKSIYKQILLFTFGIILLFILATNVVLVFEFSKIKTNFEKEGQTIKNKVHTHTDDLMVKVKSSLAENYGLVITNFVEDMFEDFESESTMFAYNLFKDIKEADPSFFKDKSESVVYEEFSISEDNGVCDIFYVYKNATTVKNTNNKKLPIDPAKWKKEQWYKNKNPKGPVWSDLVRKEDGSYETAITYVPEWIDKDKPDLICIKVKTMNLSEKFEKMGKNMKGISFYDSDLEYMCQGGLQDISDERTQTDHIIKDTKGAEGQYDLDGSLLIVHKMEQTGWISTIHITYDKFKNQAEEFESEISGDIQGGIDREEHTFRQSMTWVILGAVVASIITIFMVLILSRKICKPIYQLMDQVRDVGQGNLDRTIHVDSKNEIGKLAEEFDRMTNQVREQMENVRVMSIENERMGAEFEFVKELMDDLLPAKSVSKDSYQISASLRAEKGAGGCFFDYYAPDDKHIALVVADTEQMGVSATLQLVLAKTYLEVFCRMGYSPARIISETNNQLSRNNNMDFSVHVVMAIIDLGAGQMTYVSAGANPPLWKHAGDEFAFLTESECLPIGHMENIPYKAKTIRLTQGDTLVLYSRGVSEAMDEKGNEFTREQLSTSLNRIIQTKVDCEGITGTLMEEVREFAGEEKQSIERTVLAFRYLG